MSNNYQICCHTTFPQFKKKHRIKQSKTDVCVVFIKIIASLRLHKITPISSCTQQNISSKSIIYLLVYAYVYIYIYNIYCIPTQNSFDGLGIYLQPFPTPPLPSFTLLLDHQALFSAKMSKRDRACHDHDPITKPDQYLGKLMNMNIRNDYYVDVPQGC